MRNLNLLITEILFLFLISSCTITDVNEPVTISGKITDSSGTGISDVKILLETSSEKINAQTSSDGKYTLVIPNGGVAFATFSKEGYTSETKSIAFKGGENKAINLSMNTLKEDAYFRINISDVSVKNRRGSFSASIDTNVKYELSCKEDWIKCEIFSNNIYIEYDENKTLEKRTATITLNADFGFTHTIKITQDAGPVLQLTNYIGKDNQTNFFTSVPFITFNREVKLLSVSSSYQDIDLTAEYSADKKTIYFPNIKLPPFISTTITYEVESTDSAKIKNSFNLKVYEGKLDITTGNGQKIIFTKDGKYFWLYNPKAYNTSKLTQYLTKDLSITGSIDWKQNDYSEFFYNRYNNCLYILRNYRTDIEKMDVYDATTAKFIKEVDLSEYLKNSYISTIGFAENGLGLTFMNNKLYSTNSAQNDKFELFSDNSMLYDPHQVNSLIPREVDICNNGKIFVLTKGFEIEDVYTVDAETKELKHYYNVSARYAVTNDSYSGIVLGSYYNKNITYIDFKTGEKRNVTTNNADSFATIIATGEQYPTILTSSLATISLENGIEKKFSMDSSSTYIMNSSNDGEKIAVIYNNNLYLFKSEIFTKYSNKIK